MKPVLGRTVRFLQVLVFFVVLASAGFLMGEKGLTHRHKLKEKKACLQKENENLAEEIKALERKVTLLRSDPRTIEKAAKCKLGMARPGETVYIFSDGKRAGGKRGSGRSSKRRINSR